MQATGDAVFGTVTLTKLPNSILITDSNGKIQSTTSLGLSTLEVDTLTIPTLTSTVLSVDSNGKVVATTSPTFTTLTTGSLNISGLSSTVLSVDAVGNVTSTTNPVFNNVSITSLPNSIIGTNNNGEFVAITNPVFSSVTTNALKIPTLTSTVLSVDGVGNVTSTTNPTFSSVTISGLPNASNLGTDANGKIVAGTSATKYNKVDIPIVATVQASSEVLNIVNPNPSLSEVARRQDFVLYDISPNTLNPTSGFIPLFTVSFPSFVNSTVIDFQAVVPIFPTGSTSARSLSTVAIFGNVIFNYHQTLGLTMSGTLKSFSQTPYTNSITVTSIGINGTSPGPFFIVAPYNSNGYTAAFQFGYISVTGLYITSSS